jgi:hypothetical protein
MRQWRVYSNRASLVGAGGLAAQSNAPASDLAKGGKP